MIILLDLLFLLLFILFLNEDRSVSINTDNATLFNGAELLYKDDNNIFRHIKNKIEFNGEDSYLIECGMQPECNEARRLFNKEIFILVSPSIFTEITKITFHAYNSSVYQCDTVKFYIEKDGTIDYKKLYDENECLKKIPMLEKKYNE